MWAGPRELCGLWAWPGAVVDVGVACGRGGIWAGPAWECPGGAWEVWPAWE